MFEDDLDEGCENVALNEYDIPEEDEFVDVELEREFRFEAERARWGHD